MVSNGYFYIFDANKQKSNKQFSSHITIKYRHFDTVTIIRKQDRLHTIILIGLPYNDTTQHETFLT